MQDGELIEMNKRTIDCPVKRERNRTRRIDPNCRTASGGVIVDFDGQIDDDGVWAPSKRQQCLSSRSKHVNMVGHVLHIPEMAANR